MQYIPQIISFGSKAVDMMGGPSALISAGASALGAYSKYSAGLAEDREYEKQAAWETMGATTEILRGRQQENEVLDNLLDTIAQQRVAFGAAGNDPFIGTPAAVTADSVRRGETAGRVVMSNAKQGWFERRQKAASYRAAGNAAKKKGATEAAGTIFSAVADVLSRGNFNLGGGKATGGAGGTVKKAKTRSYGG